MKDKVIGTALSFDCRIGFHDYERHIRQRVVVDFEVDTDFRRNGLEDDPDGIVDYYLVNKALGEHLAERSYKLIEALAEDVARILCTRFPVSRATVRVTKTPFDMPNVGSVAVECVRVPGDFEA
jgi:7,8-dihydroneopterin aldolase/epimerase/oxygenase